MKILTLIGYDSVEKVDAKNLQRLIDEEKIIAFHRSGMWVRIGQDPIRGDGGNYMGPERRNIIQKPPLEPRKGFHYCVQHFSGVKSGEKPEN